MQVVHAFSSPVADATGTLTIWNGATTATVIATENVRPSDWNSVHNMQQDIAGNTAGASSVSGTNIVWAGGNNITLSGAAGAITISGPHTSQFLTTAALSNHSHGNPTLALTNLTGTTASNSAGLTLSLSAGDLTNFLTTAALSNHSHGNPTLALTNISGTTASNSAGLTLSLSAANPGAGGGATLSYWHNKMEAPQLLGGNSISTQAFQPIILEEAVSFDFIRRLASFSSNSTSFATAANSSYGWMRASTYNAIVYQRGTGASSQSLLSYASTEEFNRQSVTLSANANGSEYSVGGTVTYFDHGLTASLSWSHAVTQTRFDLSSASLSDLTGLRYLDMPFATVLAASNYWLMCGLTMSTAATGSNVGTNLLWGMNAYLHNKGMASEFNRPGIAANSSNVQFLGLGSFSTVGGATTSALGFSNITSGLSYGSQHIQLVRSA